MSRLLLLFQLILILIINGDDDNEILIRRDIKDWSVSEKNQLLEALYIMKNTTSRYDSNWNSYDYYGYVHNQSFFYDKAYAHFNWGFLPWHRQFLYYFEKELQFFSGNNSLSLPYWNPEDQVSTMYALYDTSFLGGDGNPINPKSQLSCNKWQLDPRTITHYTPNAAPIERNHTCLVRDIGSESAFVALPAVGEWDALIDRELPYDIYPYNLSGGITNASFRVDLEGRFHGSLHVHIGGDAGTNLASPIDPTFFMLHSWIDWMWWKYQKKYGLNGFENTFPAELMDVQLFESRVNPGFHFFNSLITSHYVMDIAEMGYRYDIEFETQSDDDSDSSWYKSDAFIYICISIGSILIFIMISFIVYKCCKLQKLKQVKDEEHQSLI